MATLEMGYTSSNCSECKKEFRPSSAACNESGHFTVLGYGPDNGSAGCQEKWDKVVLVYPVYNETKQGVVARLKEWYPELRHIDYDNWQVIEAGDLHAQNEEAEAHEDLPSL